MNTAPKLMLLAALLALAPVATADPPDKNGGDKKRDTRPHKADEKEKPALKADAKPIVIPFELLKSRHMAINVKINDKGPYRLIFDTGAPTNLVNNKVAKESGLTDKKDKGGFLFAAAPAPKIIKKFQVGDIELEGMPTMVMDHPTVASIAEFVGPVEGLIGFPFFARYKMTIDYEKKEMTLVPNGFKPSDTMQQMMDKLMSGASGQKPEPVVVAPAAVWGFAVDKGKDDTADGVKVTEVLEKSPAAMGGLEPNDRLLTLDGRWTDSVADTFNAASTIKPGKPVVLVVKRGDKEVKLTVTPGKGL